MLSRPRKGGCLFLANSRNSKRPATFHGRRHESISASNVSLFMHRWQPGLAILLRPVIGLLDHSNPKKWTQSTNKDSTKKCHNPRPCRTWTLGLYTCPVCTKFMGKLPNNRIQRAATNLKDIKQVWSHIRNSKSKVYMQFFNFNIVQELYCRNCGYPSLVWKWMHGK